MNDKIEIELNRRHGKKHNSVPLLLLLCLLVLLPFVYYTVSRRQRIKASKLDLEHSQTESIIYQQVNKLNQNIIIVFYLLYKYPTLLFGNVFPHTYS